MMDCCGAVLLVSICTMIHKSKSVNSSKGEASFHVVSQWLIQCPVRPNMLSLGKIYAHRVQDENDP